MDFDLTIIDAATPWLEFMAQTKPDWMRKSLKSFGYYSQQAIKAGIRKGAPGGQPYPELMPLEMINLLRAYYGGKARPNDPFLGKLINAVGYEYDAGNNLVRVGWLSNSAVKLGEKIEAGSVRAEITDKMRRFFWASGVGLSTKTQITVPARKTFGPMQAILAPKAAIYIENKIISYATSGTGWEKKTTKRKYRVRG